MSGNTYTHISQQFATELSEVKSHLLEMGGKVEKQLRDALTISNSGDYALLSKIEANERTINSMEVKIDRECLNILARRQPAAGDLRLIVVTSKVLTDLERMGDEAAKIGHLAVELDQYIDEWKGLGEIETIGTQVVKMLHDALDAFARLDVDFALEVARSDKSVDQAYGAAIRGLVTQMTEDPQSITPLLNVIWVLRSLERIGDHARNISEYVVYLVQGEDIRHLGTL